MINLNEYSIVQYGDAQIKLFGPSQKLVLADIIPRDWAMVRELLCPICEKELTEPKSGSKLLFCHTCRLIFTLWRGR